MNKEVMEGVIWIVGILCLTLYSLYRLRLAKDPKDELLKAKQLLDEKLISEEDYQKIKNKLIKKIVDD